MASWNNGKTIVCLNCGKSFYVPLCRTLLAKYCSPKCLSEHKRTKRNLNNKRICKGCKKEYIPVSWYQKFCTRECSYLFRRKKSLRSCAVCGKEFYPSRQTTKFCSPECHVKFRPPGKKRKDWDQFPKKGKNNYLDNLWKEVIYKNSNYQCEYCGKKKSLNAHHIFSRSNYSTRWLPENGIALCVGCHIFGNFSAHKSPIEFIEWLKARRGDNWYEELRQRARPFVFNLDELKETIKVRLQGELKKESLKHESKD